MDSLKKTLGIFYIKVHRNQKFYLLEQDSCEQNLSPVANPG